MQHFTQWRLYSHLFWIKMLVKTLLCCILNSTKILPKDDPCHIGHSLLGCSSVSIKVSEKNEK